MILIDWLLKPIDTFWRAKFHAEEIRANKASADLKYSESVRSEQEKNLAVLTERDMKQARAITAYNREIEELKLLVDKKTAEIEQRDREISVLKEALRSERTAQDALRMNAKLWEQIKTEVTALAHDG